MPPLRLRLAPAASMAARLVGATLAFGVPAALVPSVLPPAARPWALGACAAGWIAASAWAIASTGLGWTVDLSETGAVLVPRLGRGRRAGAESLSLRLGQGEMVEESTGVRLALGKEDAARLAAWLDPDRFVAYGSTPGPVRWVPRAARYRSPPGESPVPFVSGWAWQRVRPGRILHAAWRVPESERAATAADLVALTRAIEEVEGDPTAPRSGDRVPVWPVCCGSLARLEMTDPVRHELLWWLDEEVLAGLGRALIDPLLVAAQSEARPRAAWIVERDFQRALDGLLGGVRPTGLDVFRCAACRRVYAVYG